LVESASAPQPGGHEDRRNAVKYYESYVRETHKLCLSATGESANGAEFNEQLRQMHEKIINSRLTVYQKDFLLQELSSTHEAKQA
jgi:hypothetical protein